MTYVTSDIHGWSNKYEKLLQAINLTTKDRLYVIGDVIDRGPDGVDIMRDLMTRPNVTVLMGNHERMCLDALSADGTDEDIYLWDYNGGAVTATALTRLRRRDPDAFAAVIDFMSSRPYSMDVEVEDKKFHLVHAFPSDDDYQKIWHRPRKDEKTGVDDAVVIVGHTPTNHLAPPRVLSRMFRELGHTAIYHAPHFVAIDCGGAYPQASTRLACLRLDDMQEFYA